jgi:hypothetical protein
MEAIMAFREWEWALGMKYTLLCIAVFTIACLSMFRRSRFWVLFIVRALWIFTNQFGENLWLSFAHYSGWDGALKSKKKHMAKGKSQQAPEEKEEAIRYGLVVPEGREGGKFRTPKNRNTSGLVDPVAQPMKQYPGSMSRGKGNIGHARIDSGISMNSDWSTEAEASKTAQSMASPNGTMGKKKKKKNRVK